MLTPLALRVVSRIRCLNRSSDFGAIVRLMSGPAVKLNPRNFRSCGRATALLASFTLSLRFCVMKREMQKRHAHPSRCWPDAYDLAGNHPTDRGTGCPETDRATSGM